MGAAPAHASCNIVRMLQNHAVIAFLATPEPERAARFYRDVLGLRFIADEPFALVFDAHGTMLRIQKAPQHQPLPYTALGWRTPDIAAAVDGLTERGVAFERFAGFAQDERGVWAAPDGTKVAWFKDPDGNLLSLTAF